MGNKPACNSCSQGGSYFGFGKTKPERKAYTLVKGKLRRVYVDSKGKFYKEKTKKKYLSKRKKIYNISKTTKMKMSKKIPKKTKKTKKRKNKFNSDNGLIHLNIPYNNKNILPHMHYGKTCFGS